MSGSLPSQKRSHLSIARLSKILSLPELKMRTEEAHRNGLHIVQCHGVFDLFHYGHLLHLQEAKSWGEVLLVSITADKYVQKGPGRPIHSQEQRAAVLAALDCVDMVVVLTVSGPEPAIEAAHPDIYAKGPDYRDSDTWALPERALVERLGGIVRFTAGLKLSSSALINNLAPSLNQEAMDFVRAIRDRYGKASILSWLDRMASLSVLVVGEPILDRYIFVSPEGKSQKESIVVFRERRKQEWQGGAAVVAAHLATLCDKVEFSAGCVTGIVKTRWILEPFDHKIFETVDSICVQRGKMPSSRALRSADLAVVTDFGHGLFPGRSETEQVANHAKFLALTVQANSLNFGFNVVLKWPRADYCVVDEDELRLAYRAKDATIEDLAKMLKHALTAKALAVTLGHRGSLVKTDTETVHCPALATNVRDRMGAGDAFLAMTSPLVALGASGDIIALYGSVASAIEVGKMGNEPISRTEINGWLEGLLS